MRNRIFFFILFCCSLFVGCKQTKPGNENGKPEKTLTVSIEPLRYVAERIAGGAFNVTTFVPKGSSPETYEPTPEQMARLGESLAYFSIGELGFERIWMDRLQQNAPGVTFVKTAEGITPLAGHCHGGTENVTDPHVWTSPRNMAVIAQNICTALCRLDTVHADMFHRNLQVMHSEIQNVDDSIQSLLEHASTKAFLIYHPALTYFAHDYGLTQIAIETDGKEPSPAKIVRLINHCKAQNVRIIFVQKEFDRKNAELIAKETGTRIVSINPLAYDWKEEMLRIAQTLDGQCKKDL